MHVWRRRHVALCDLTLDASTLIRDKANIAQTRSDCYMVALVNTGTVKFFSDTDAIDIHAGAGIFLDMENSFSIDIQNASISLFAFSRIFIQSRGHMLSDAHGKVLSADATDTVRGYIEIIFDRYSAAAGRGTDGVEEFALSYIGSLLQRVGSGAHEDRRISRASLRAKIRKYIETRFSDSNLDIDAICRHVGTSRATIYRLYRNEGGIANFIKRLRLRAVRYALLNPNNFDSIQEIARSFGFVDSSHFSRSFRKEYGVSATALRSSQLASGDDSWSLSSHADFTRLDEVFRELDAAAYASAQLRPLDDDAHVVEPYEMHA